MCQGELAIAHVGLHGLDAMVQVVLDGARHRLGEVDDAGDGLLLLDPLREFGARVRAHRHRIERIGSDCAAGKDQCCGCNT